jgi:hypothetical protein
MTQQLLSANMLRSLICHALYQVSVRVLRLLAALVLEYKS